MLLKGMFVRRILSKVFTIVMLTVFLFQFAFPGTVQNVQAVDVQPVYPGGDQWVLTFDDEFYGTSLDTTKWTIRTGDYRYDPSFVSVGGGTLNLKIARDGGGTVRGARVDTTAGTPDYTTKWDQQYGFFECRADVPPTEQTLFGFWMSNYPGVDNVDGTGHDGCEIDVIETMEAEDLMRSNLHWDGYGAYHQATGSPAVNAPNLHSGFHVYGLEWDSSSLKFYYDGTLTWTYTGVAVPYVREFLILSTETGFGDGNIGNAMLPYYANVDYMRAWTKAGSPTQTTYYPSADAYVRDGTYASTNYGTQIDLQVKSDATSYARKAYLTYNFSGFSGSSTTSAKLRVNVVNAGTDASRTIKLYGTTDENWTESGIIWNNAPAGSTYITSVNMSNTTGVWYEMDVTSYVNSHMTDKIVSFLLINEGAFASQGYISFNSKEAASNKPELTIQVATTPELLTNPGFESGAVSPWVAWNGSLAVGGSYAHSGSYGSLTSGRSAAWGGPAQDITSVLTSRGQGNYNVNAWVKLASGSDNVKITTKLTYGGSDHYLSTTVSGSTSWVQISGTQNLTWSGTLTSAYFYVETTSSTANLYVDDCSLKKP